MLNKSKEFFEKMENKKIAKELNARMAGIAKKKKAAIIERLTQFALDYEYHQTGLLLTRRQAKQIAINKFNIAKMGGVLDEMNNFIK